MLGTLPLLLTLLAADSPAEGRVKELVDAINSKDRATIQRFVQDAIAPSFTRAVPESDNVDTLFGFSQQAAPLSIVSLTLTQPGVAAARLKTTGMGEMYLTLDVEEAAPFRITGIRLGGPPTETKPLNLTGWKTLDELAKMTREQGALPAIGIAVAKADGFIESTVAGERDVTTHAPAAKDDRWWIGSLTKSMTATVVAHLIEEGKLRWEETLAEALPDVKMRDEYRAVTLEQLMQHRGGLPQDLTFRGATVQAIVGGEKEPMKIRARYVADILNREPIGAPGPSRYSNAGYSVLSHIVERTTGKPYEQTMQELLFQPLRMASAVVVHDPGAGMPDSDLGMHGHIREGDKIQVRRFVSPLLTAMTAGAGGGVAMTVEDLARYGQLHLRGLQGKDGLLKAATIKRLHTPIGAGERYASGWLAQTKMPTGPFEHHNGSNGSMLADIAIWPDRGLVVASITNVGSQEMLSPTLQAAISVAQRTGK